MTAPEDASSPSWAKDVAMPRPAFPGPVLRIMPRAVVHVRKVTIDWAWVVTAAYFFALGWFVRTLMGVH